MSLFPGLQIIFSGLTIESIDYNYSQVTQADQTYQWRLYRAPATTQYAKPTSSSRKGWSQVATSTSGYQSAIPEEGRIKYPAPSRLLMRPHRETPSFLIYQPSSWCRRWARLMSCLGRQNTRGWLPWIVRVYVRKVFFSVCLFGAVVDFLNWMCDVRLIWNYSQIVPIVFVTDSVLDSKSDIFFFKYN